MLKEEFQKDLYSHSYLKSSNFVGKQQTEKADHIFQKGMTKKRARRIQ